MTPLFPNDNEIITLMQGKTGDCYLLAALDCIFNLGDEGRNKVKSQFTETDDGVIVRIKHHAQSVGLGQKTQGSKYEYSFDPITNEDVFKISKENLKIIDQADDGVRTNSLAVKILERLSAYYFVSDWDKTDVNASIIAHNLNDRYSGSPTQFVGRLTNIDTYDTTNVEDIIKLKAINPKLPAYISIRYGNADKYGVMHRRHALRIEHIIPTKPSGYEFVLVNPWDNRRRERYSLTEIEKRKCRFSTYSLDKNEYAVTRALLHCPTAHGEYVFANPTLLNILIEMQKKKLILTPQEIAVCIQLHQQMPYLHLLLNSIPVAKQEKMLIEISNTSGQQEHFIKWAITNFPSLAFIKVILEQHTDHQSMGKILTDLALSAKKEQPLHTVFSDPAFFKLVWDTALQHKKVQQSCTMESAKKELELGLIHHFLQSKERYPTRNAGLRPLIYAKIFTETTLKSVISPEMLLAYSIAHLIQKDTVPAHVRELITQSDVAVINQAFLTIFLDRLSCKNLRELFVGIKKISGLNPELAKTLFSLLAPKINALYKVSYEQFAKEINLETNEFRTWFFTMPQPPGAPSEQELIALKEATEVIDTHIKQIISFEVTPNDGKSREEIDKQRLELITNLKAIIKDKVTLQNAYNTLGIRDVHHPRIIKELQAKLEMIKQAAHQQATKVEHAEGVVATYVQQIREFQVDFSHTSTPKEVEKQRLALGDQLRNLVEQAELRQAKASLSSPTHVAREFSNKLQEIQSAAEQQIKITKLTQAEKVVESYIQRIQLFRVMFDAITTKEIEDQHLNLKKQLENIVKDQSDLQQAEQSLGISGRHPQITKALAEKMEATHLAAEQQRANLKKAEEVITIFLQRINSFAIPPNDGKNKHDIEAQQRRLTHQLEMIINDNEELNQAQRTLRVVAIHSPIVKAVNEKLQQIRQASREQQSKLDNAEQVVEIYLKQINRFPVEFEHATTSEAVKEQHQVLTTQLANILQNKNDLEQAERTLGFSHRHPKVTRAYSDKLENINFSAEQQCQINEKKIRDLAEQQRLKLINKAEKVITTFVQRINSLPIEFNHDLSHQDVDVHARSLINQLEQISNHHELVQALHILDSTAHLPKIYEAIESKKQIILEGAEEQKRSLNEAGEVLLACIQQLDSFAVPPNKGKNDQDIERRQRMLVSQLENTVKNRPELTQAERLLGYTDQHPDIRRILKYKNEEIRKEAERATISQREIVVVLEHINFFQHLQTIGSMARVMEEKIEQDENYVNAAQFARTLHTKLLEEEERVLTSNKSQKIRIEEFKNNCLVAIETALPVLETHRGWKQFLADVASAILAVLTVGVVNLATGRWRLFTPQTNSEKITKEVESVIQSISVGA